MNKEFELTKDEKKKLLNMVRETITAYVSGNKIPPFKITEPNLKEHAGAFVSYHMHSGELKGCIGSFESDKPLWETITAMAIAAGTKDPRFSPLNVTELNKVDIEISVLSPLRDIENIEEIEVGKHGIFITKGFHRGVLLPQVAAEYGWNREEFLEHTCLKAGLPGNAWKQGANIQIFSAAVFSENSE